MPDLVRCTARALVLALLGAIPALVVPRPALADGCLTHDRPALDLALSYDTPGHPDLSPSAVAGPRLAPRPCTGDVPAPPAHAVPDASIAATLRLMTPIDAGTRRPEPVPPSSTPLDRPSRLDRPPRAAAR